jgi:mono/diheme cytochrome c family protein
MSMKRSIVTVALTVSVAGLAFAAGDATAGKAAYDKACKSCHGADGTPNAAIAKSMKVEMKNLGAADVQALSDDDLKKAITAGQGKMKPVKSVSGKAADDVVAYIRTLKK